MHTTDRGVTKASNGPTSAAQLPAPSDKEAGKRARLDKGAHRSPRATMSAIKTPRQNVLFMTAAPMSVEKEMVVARTVLRLENA